MDFGSFIKKDLEPEDYHTLLPYFKLRYSHVCENMLTSNYMWKNYYNTHYLRDERGLLWLMEADGRPMTMAPLCRPEDLGHYFKVAETYFNECLHAKLVMSAVDREAEEILHLDPKCYEVVASRNNFDYIYDAKKMMSFSGKAYHKKKNHVNAFWKTYGNRCEYSSLDCKNACRDEIMEFLTRWKDKRHMDRDDSGIEYELEGINYLLVNGAFLDYKMGAVYIDGRMEAFSLGVYGKVEKMAVIHAEKANPEVRGLYPFICQQFLIHEFPDALLVNREDDLGLESLRSSKLSYHPIYMEEKYEIRQR